jgi:uncharacterized coiled-coil protein SlyX
MCVFAEQKQQLQSYSKSVADLQTVRDELEGKLQQFQEKMSDCEQLVQSHQVVYKDEFAVFEVLPAKLLRI